MKLKNVALASAAVTLVIAPAMAQAAPVDRTGAPAAGESELRGNSSLILAAIAVIAIVVGIILLTGDDDDDSVSA